MWKSHKISSRKVKKREHAANANHASFSSTSLLLFPPLLIIDQDVSFGPTRLKRELQKLGHEVIHVKDVGATTWTDISIAKSALACGATVLTSDKTFVQSVLSQGSECPNHVIIVPQLKTERDISETITTLASIIDIKARTTVTTSKWKTLTIIYKEGKEFKDRTLHLPNHILLLFALLEARGDVGLSADELGFRWKCSVSTARRRAEKYVQEGWLCKIRRGRRVYYVQSSSKAHFSVTRAGSQMSSESSTFS